MAFSRQMHHHVRLIVRKHSIQFSAVDDIDLFKCKTRAAGDWFKRGKVTGIGQLIHHHHTVSGFINNMPDDCGANKAGAAGNQNTFHRHTPLVSTIHACWTALASTALKGA